MFSCLGNSREMDNLLNSKNLCRITLQNFCLPTLNGKIDILEIFFSIEFYHQSPKKKQNVFYESEVRNNEQSTEFLPLNLPDSSVNETKFVTKIWCRTNNKDPNWIWHSEVRIDMKTIILLKDQKEYSDSLLKENCAVFSFDSGFITIALEEYLNTDSCSSFNWLNQQSVRSYSLECFNEMREMVLQLQLFSTVSEGPIDEISLLRARINELNNALNKVKKVTVQLQYETQKMKKEINENRNALKTVLTRINFLHGSKLNFEKTPILREKETLKKLICKVKNLFLEIEEVFFLRLEDGGESLYVNNDILFSGTENLLFECYESHMATYREKVNFSLAFFFTESSKDCSRIGEINVGLFYLVQCVCILSLIANVELKHLIDLKSKRNYFVVIESERGIQEFFMNDFEDRTYATSKKETKEYPLYCDEAFVEKRKPTSRGTEEIASRFLFVNWKFEKGLLLLNENIVEICKSVFSLYERYYDITLQKRKIPEIDLECFFLNFRRLMFFVKETCVN